jgi:hypothetical protein
MVILMTGCFAAKITKPNSAKANDLSKTPQVKTVTLFDIFLVRKIFDENSNDLEKIIAMEEKNPTYCITANGPYDVKGDILRVKNVRVMCYTSSLVLGNKPEENMLSPMTVKIDEALIKLDTHWPTCVVLEKLFTYEGAKEKRTYYVTVYGRRDTYNYRLLLPRTKVDF